MENLAVEEVPESAVANPFCWDACQDQWRLSQRHLGIRLQPRQAGGVVLEPFASVHDAEDKLLCVWGAVEDKEHTVAQVVTQAGS